MAVLIRCSKCGNEIQEEGKFCPFCGNRISVNENGTSNSNRSFDEEYERRKQEYSTELKRMASEKKELENKKTRLLKKKQSLMLKIGNYENLRAGKIPNCSKNTDAPDMTIVKKETSNIWYVMAIISLLEIVAQFIPWVSVYYGDAIASMSVSCGSIFELIQNVSYYSQWTEDLNGILYFLIMISVMNLCIIGINIYLLIGIVQKKYDNLVFKGELAGWGAIGLSVIMFLMVWGINLSMEEDYWRIISLHQGMGIWFILASGIAMAAASGYASKEMQNEKNLEVLSVDITNFDPVLPIRFDKLTVTRNDNLELELSFNEFDWTYIEELVAGIQLIGSTGRVETFARNVAFNKCGNHIFRAEFPDANYDFEAVSEARINIMKYMIYGNNKRDVEFGSGYSILGDYTADELRQLKRSEKTPVFCLEKELGENRQCSCGQIYSQKLHTCPLCGKERKA